MGGGCGPVPNDIELSVARTGLAATTLNDCCNREVVLFGGDQKLGGYTNNIDIFDCEDIVG